MKCLRFSSDLIFVVTDETVTFSIRLFLENSLNTYYKLDFYVNRFNVIIKNNTV